jgi:hypothetical protein
VTEEFNFCLFREQTSIFLILYKQIFWNKVGILGRHSILHITKMVQDLTVRNLAYRSVGYYFYALLLIQVQ